MLRCCSHFSEDVPRTVPGQPENRTALNTKGTWNFGEHYCDKGDFGQTPQLAESQCFFCPDDGHIEEEVQLTLKKKRSEKHTEKNKVRNTESRNRQPRKVDDHVDDVTRTNTFLTHAV